MEVMQVAGIPSAEEHVAVPWSEIRPIVDDRVRRRDVRGVPNQRQDRIGPVLVRVVDTGRRGTDSRRRGETDGAPSIVATGDQAVHFVVARGAVLRNKHVTGSRLERDAEVVPMPVCEDVRVHARVAGERIVIGDAAIGVQSEDLSGQARQVLGVRGVVGISDHGVELAIRTELNRATDVPHPGRDVIEQNLHRPPGVACRLDSHDPVVVGPVHGLIVRIVRVHPGLVGERRIEGETQEPLVVPFPEMVELVERGR